MTDTPHPLHAESHRGIRHSLYQGASHDVTAVGGVSMSVRNGDRFTKDQPTRWRGIDSGRVCSCLYDAFVVVVLYFS